MDRPRERLILLFDVDNTLLDNDRITADLRTYLESTFGHDRQQRYWARLEELRAELGYVDYLGALQRYRADVPRDPHLLNVSQYLIDYPFADRLFPQALAVLSHVRQWGRPVILSDGDVVFQPRKIHRSGLAAAVRDEVLIYIHKEDELDDVEQRYPADHYVLVDDKPRIITAVKEQWREKVTAVFVRQGHYAWDPAAEPPRADLTIDRIGELLHEEDVWRAPSSREAG